MTTEYDAAAGIARVVDLALAAPARLGRARLVAIDGPSGSGKTSVAEPLAAALADAIGGRVVVPQRVAEPQQAAERQRVAEPHLAALYLPRVEGQVQSGEADTVPPGPAPRVAVVSTDLLATWEHPLDWWPILEEHLLTPIAAGRVAVMPVIAWVSGHPRPGGAIFVPPVDVLVLEGVSAGRAAAAARLSALVWMEVPSAAERLERAVARDGAAMREHLARWQRGEEAHFAADSTRRRATVVIRG